MKKISVLFFLCTLSVFLCAQEVNSEPQRTLITESMPNATIHQDSAITKMMYERVFGMEQETVEIDGFRVQIYSSNRQQIAKSEATMLEKNLTGKVDVNIYVSYTPPFWKVRLGDFKTREEALEFKNSFIESHPELTGDTYIVRDKIQVLK